MRTTPDPHAFETFYKDVRGRLLLQTWALTGDLPAAQKAVRDALVISWHHWRKISRLQDPESFVRPQAWSRALRRHSTRPFRRERGFDEGIRATLTALAKLPLLQRKVLLLAHLTTLPLDQLAREAGITQARAERELQAATAAFALAREVPTTGILALFEPMAAELRELRWPRPTILTRAGTARRRLHTGVGAVVAVGAFVGSGVLVTDADGARPALDALRLHVPSASSPAAPKGYPLSSDDLLSADQVGAALGGTWTTEMTSDSTDGDGLVLPCQQQRFADKASRAALLRTLVPDTAAGAASPSAKDSASASAKDSPTASSSASMSASPPSSTTSPESVGQSTEVSTSAAAAHAAYAASLRWYAGCSRTRVQLMSTQAVGGVGDEATLVELRDWNDPTRSIVASVARTGVLTTTVVSAQPAAAAQPVRTNTGLLTQAVQQLCALPQAGACATAAKTRDVAPIPVGEHPAMLGSVDLPPVTGINQPWVATTPAAATTNIAATRCDQSVFHRKGVTGDLTRSYLIPAAKSLPAQFGLTETIGSLGTPKAAASFVGTVRSKIARCPKNDLGTKVHAIETSDKGPRSLSVWRLNLEISDKTSVVFLMAVVRQGDNVAQLGFVPSGSATMSEDRFVALAHRAADRLAQLR